MCIGDPADNFSILKHLNDGMKDVFGDFEFKLVWPNTGDPKNYNIWKQSNNPMETQNQDINEVNGY